MHACRPYRQTTRHGKGVICWSFERLLLAGIRVFQLRPYTTGMLWMSLQGCFAPHIPVLYREVPFFLNITACLRWIYLWRRYKTFLYKAMMR